MHRGNCQLSGPLPRAGNLDSGLAMPSRRDAVGMAREIPHVVDNCAVHVYTHTEYEEERPCRDRP